MPDSETFVFVDGHVHIYACYDPGQVLDGAWLNFRSLADRRGVAGSFQGVLILTEAAGDHAFAALSKAAGGPIGRWRVSTTADADTLSLRRDDGAHLLLCAGRQLVSAERLELSAYFMTEPIADGAPLDQLLKQVSDAGGVPVLPWGVGKWLGKRNNVVKQTLTRGTIPLMVSDNGGRPWFWPMPSLFGLARRRGIPVLAGSDSLPRSTEQQKAGSFGFILRGALLAETPGRDLRSRLLSLGRSPDLFGKPEGAWSFFRNQLHMQLTQFG